MFKFLLKREFKSPVLIAVVVITSFFLVIQFSAYFKYFPINSEEQFQKMHNAGGAYDFSSSIYTHDEQTQLVLMKEYYSNILNSDKELTVEQRTIIENKILKVENIDEFYNEYTEFYFYCVDNGGSEKQENYYNNLIDFSGDDYNDVNQRIDNSIKDCNISKYFSMRFADRMIVIWSLCIFLFITYRYYFFNRSKVKDLIYPKAFKSSRHIINNIATELLSLIIITSIQMFAFALLFDNHLKGFYSTSIYDYIQVYLVWVVPSLAIIIGLLNFLYYLFDSAIVVFPIYYIIQAISSKVSADVSYVINKTNIIIRYDKLLEGLTTVEYNNIAINRIIMISLFIILIPLMVYILNMKRNGRLNFKLILRRNRSGQKY